MSCSGPVYVGYFLWNASRFFEDLQLHEGVGFQREREQALQETAHLISYEISALSSWNYLESAVWEDFAGSSVAVLLAGDRQVEPKPSSKPSLPVPAACQQSGTGLILWEFRTSPWTWTFRMRTVEWFVVCLQHKIGLSCLGINEHIGFVASSYWSSPFCCLSYIRLTQRGDKRNVSWMVSFCCLPWLSTWISELEFYMRF